MGPAFHTNYMIKEAQWYMPGLFALTFKQKEAMLCSEMISITLRMNNR